MELLVLPMLVMLGLGLVWVETDEGTLSEKGPEPGPQPGPTPAPNVAEFGNGDNNADGTTGTDIYSLGKGADTARMGAGSDTVFGEEGDDQIVGGGGNDEIFLGDGDDQNYVTRADGNDFAARNFGGDDLVRGGDGDDRLIDYGGSNTLYGDLGDDLIDGVDESGTITAPDSLYGGFGADLLFGDSGDLMAGGAGVDTFGVIVDATPDAPAQITDYAPGEKLFVSVPLMFAASDAVLEQVGDDLELRLGDATLLVLKGVSDPDEVDMVVSTADFADQTIDPGELVMGSNGDDDLTTGGGDDAIFAGRGDDAVDSGAGDDYVSLRSARPFEAEGDLGWGSNVVDAGAGADQVLGGMSDDDISGRGGNDVLLGGGGHDVLRGGGGSDRIDGCDLEDDQADRIFGGAGNDVISADDGDLVSGGAGADTFMVEEFRNTDEVVTLTDFDPGRDVLEVAVNGPGLKVSYEDIGDGTRVMVGDRAVFELRDVTPREMRSAEVRVSRYA